MNLFTQRRFRWCVMLLLCFITHSAFSQSKQPAATGTVLNESSAPMLGVTVVASKEKGSYKKMAITDRNGVFKFDNLETGSGYIFTFTSIGYTEKVMNGYSFDGSKGILLSVTMEPGTSNTAEELVVVGYGQSTKRDVTGSTKSIKAGDFNKGIVNSPEQLLQGKISGVNVTSSSGAPGATQSITIRGPGSIRTGSTPLFVVDGLPLDNASTGGAGNPLVFLNPQDIESMDVLKDASATAIYGSRGANGVIIITTKKGKAGASTMNYSFTGGTSKIANKLPVYSAEEYKKQVVALGGTLQDFGASTDWQDEITRTAYTQGHNLALSGGSGKFNYYGSFGMQLQQGILKGNDLKRYSGRMNITQKAFDDRLTIEAGITINNVKDQRPSIGGLIGGALSTNPTIPAYGADGKPYVLAVGTGTNPLATLATEQSITTTNRVLGNIAASLKLYKGLVYKLNFGVDNSTATKDSQSLPLAAPTRLGGLITGNYINRNYLIENYLTYNTSFGLHKFTALAGHSFQKYYIQTRSNSISTFPLSGVDPIYNPGQGQLLTLANNAPTGTATINELQSFFGRINYSYMDKYLLTATFRADGSTKFGENNKYGYFPSFSGAWIASNEEFLKNSIFSSLKLRAGWGQTGNQEIPSKFTQAKFTSTVSGTTSYPLYPTGAYPAGATYTRLPNPDLQWEQAIQTDLGIDFELFNGGLSGTVDYFNKQTKHILLQITPSDPIQSAPLTFANVDNMVITNKGVELDLTYRHTTKGGLSYSVGGNITFIDNKVSKSPYTLITSGSASGSGLTSATVNGYVNGEPIGTFFLKEFIGFDANGKSAYKDLNKDNVIGDQDRAALGSALPTKIFGVTATVAYKRFDLAANFNGVAGNKIYDNTANASFYKALLVKGINTTPDAIASPQESISNAADVSSRYMKDGNFFRLSNLALGYSFNTKALGLSNWISAMRLSLTAQNVFVITPYNGYDPEVNTDRNVDNVTSYGIDYQSYPKARTFILGFNVTF